MPIRAYRLNPAVVALLATLVVAMPSASAWAQAQAFTQANNAVGVGLWYGIGRFVVDGAASNASDEVKGYTDVLPREFDGAGPALGFSFKNWGVNIGYTEFDVDLKNRRADVNQTPATTADDVRVRSLHVAVTSVTILYRPIRGFYLGYGRDQGTLEFKQKSAAGGSETRRIGIDSPFYSVSIALGFDPTKSQVAPIFALFAKIPAEKGDFSASQQGLGLGPV